VKRLLPWALLAASLAANAAMLLAPPRPFPAAATDEPLIFAKASLDPDQRVRIRALRSELLARRAEHERRLAGLRGQLAAALGKEPEARAEIDATLGRISEAQAAFQRAVVEHVLGVRAVLTPEQRPAFESIVATQVQSSAPVHCVIHPTTDPSHP
jgi:Spy/CpxP family protein refolding chaperone